MYSGVELITIFDMPLPYWQLERERDNLKNQVNDLIDDRDNHQDIAQRRQNELQEKG